ncbi:hypothetical protein [Nocardia concava]|uniref:hypothetical protein n=1 Tax=Nocardia concava TaxID=257281 RepID=UPI000306FCFD|nr:hypothetical protein [Nocardia concava]
MLWHLTVDFGIGSPLHFLATYEAAITFAREAVEGGWARAVAVDDRVDQSYPAMPCQGLFAQPCPPNSVRIPNFTRKVADAP